MIADLWASVPIDRLKKLAYAGMAAGTLITAASGAAPPSAQAMPAPPEHAAAPAAAATTTTVSWITFIPQSRIDAPPVGCDYGRGYAFGGNGRGYDWKSSSYKTAVHAVIDWSSKSVKGYVSMGTTRVYRKSNGELVDKKTTSGAKSYARKIEGSGSGYVDVRLVTHAQNPFCGLGAIDGALSMRVFQRGEYYVWSGNHRQMPNHHVYIYDGRSGRVTDVYTRDAASPLCLVACELARFYGQGSF